jgi:hypothetical protein
MATTIRSDQVAHTVAHAWTGAAYSSPSIELVDGAEKRRNLVSNPSFEDGLNGWTTSATSDTTKAHSGTRSALMTTVNGDTSYLSTATNLPVLPGESYTSSAWVFAAADLAVTYYLQALIFDASGAILTFIPSSTGIKFATPEWTRISQSFVIPAGAASLGLILSPSNETPGATDALNVDDVLLESGSELLPYFDGSTASSSVLGESSPLLIDGWQESVDTRNVLNPVVGGGVDYTLYPASLRSGQFVAVFDDEDAAAELLRMHQRPARFTLQDADRPSVAMLYIADGTVTRALDDESRDYWLVTIPFQEVDA